MILHIVDVHFVRYENNDPNTVRVVPWNEEDFDRVRKPYNQFDSGRLQRDSFVVRHTDLIRTSPEMEDEFDHGAYEEHHKYHDPMPAFKSDKKQQEMPMHSLLDESDSLESSSEDPEPSSMVGDTRKLGLHKRKKRLNRKKRSKKNKKELDKMYRKRWDDYRLLCGDDKRRLLTNINGTLPNIERISSTFVILIGGLSIELTQEGSGCIISDDGRFVLTAGHVINYHFDKDIVIHMVRWKMSGETSYSKAERQRYIKMVEERAKDGKIYQNEKEKLLTQHTFYRCHKFRKNGKAKCLDEIQAKAFHAHPRFAKALREKSGSQGLFQSAVDSIFGDKLSIQERLERFDFGILELEYASKRMKEDVHKVAFGMISHLTETKEMQQFASEIKGGLWGYSGDKDISDDAKKGTSYDPRAGFDEAKDNECVVSDQKPITRRCWGVSVTLESWNPGILS